MSISVDKAILLKRALRYGAISVFLLVFHGVYSLFAHGVNSFYMQFAFLIPLIGGSVVSLFLLVLSRPNEVVIQVWRMGLSTLVVGFLLHGVFDIYGTEVAMVNLFFIIGIGLLLVAFLLYLITSIRSNQQQQKS